MKVDHVFKSRPTITTPGGGCSATGSEGMGSVAEGGV